jgi:hypothetical protein
MSFPEAVPFKFPARRESLSQWKPEPGRFRAIRVLAVPFKTLGTL